jgi:septum formation protein
MGFVGHRFLLSAMVRGAVNHFLGPKSAFPCQHAESGQIRAMPAPRLILASASPRRHELLAAAGIDFTVETARAEELHDARMAPEELVVWNALAKAREVAARHPDAAALGADTLVYLGNEPLGKPGDLAEAAAMLRRLSGCWHEVWTGLALVHGDRVLGTRAVKTRVRFATLDDETIAAYHFRVSPLDKAGAYGIQEHTDLLGAEADGPLDNVIGLPVEAALELIGRHMG